ncbi:RlpA-like double-psi beta-barrel-protein domain-containing protein-containing protein [Mucor mucedo]|uniref:RlpA-like double-psi beta-barrel-protein domain-containing protein-containing protein n=1 Tax=Mucor mucedo TaxID=29922 RepID=UPI00221FDF14|nr:RlpA-like double-psi beta-barrel-protein domain-containing protein-containing protein [Mucor mucedo]KAI7880269.1 RlpA-like double-psi beta-barrel-protein domain-containing protein-containing protein [Mucor mucedo]
MNKILNLVFILISLFALVQHTESLPLDLGRTTKHILAILGIATFYDVEAGLGSCGIQSSASEFVVAVNHEQMGNEVNPNNNPRCKQQVKIDGPKGKSIMADIVDTCPGCNYGCLDMSTSLFQEVCGGLELGICKIKWTFV